MTLTEKLKEYSLVIEKDGKEYCFSDRGVKPLLDALDKELLQNSIVYDRVTGRASALLLAYAKVQKLYTLTLSKPSEEILNYFNIPFFTEKIVSNIINRNKTGICPMEEMTLTVTNPVEAYELLKARINKRT